MTRPVPCLTVPSPLRDCTGDRTAFPLEAGTVAEALREMLERYPLLRFHLYDRITPSPRIDDLLREIDRDPTAIFWG